MSLCPEWSKRAQMTDQEFWDYVLLGTEPGADADPPDPPEVLEVTGPGAPCLECGAVGPCFYDPEGRPLIHDLSAGVDLEDDGS